jgi:hypothetical protein
MVTRLLITILVLTISVGATEVLAKKYEGPFEWEPITEADWAVSADTGLKIHDAAILFEKVHTDDGDLLDDKCYWTVYQRVRILNADGRAWGDIAVPVFHSNQKVERVIGRTVLPDGTIVELTEGQIFKTEVAKTKDEKYEQTTFSLPGVTDNCIVEYIYICRVPYVFHQWFLQKDLPVLRFEFTWKLGVMDWISGYFTAPNYLWLNPTSTQSVTKLPNVKETKEILFETSNVPPFEIEPFGMPDNSLKERIICYYGSKEAPAAYWSGHATSNSRRFETLCEKDKKLRTVVQSFGPLATDEEKIEAAYQWVLENLTNTTYSDLYHHEDTARVKKLKVKDNKHIDDVIKRGYGGRDDINRVFLDMLREMNIDAKLAYAKGRRDDMFIFKAKYSQLNRSAVAVPNGLDTYHFYSPGHACTPIRMVPWYLEGVIALLSDADEYLVSVPFSGPEANLVSITTKLEFTDNLSLNGGLNAQFTGHPARRYRIMLFDEPLADHVGLLAESLAKDYPLAELDSLTCEAQDALNLPLKLTCRLEYPEVMPAGGRILFKPFDYLLDAENKFVSAERAGPVLFRHAYKVTEAAAFQLPEGWKVEALPTDTAYKGVAGQCAVRFTDLGGSVSVQRVFALYGPYWVQENYAEVRSLFRARQEMSDLIVILSESRSDQVEE